MEFDNEFTPKHQRLCGVLFGVSVLSTQPLREKRSRCRDAEWAQIMIQDILDQTVTVRDKTRGNLPFQVVSAAIAFSPSDCLTTIRSTRSQSSML